jgi:hypothetical protein
VRVEDVYDAADEQRRLARILAPRYLRMLEAVHLAIASLFGQFFPGLTPEAFRLDDPATRKQLALAAERVVLIDTATRSALRDVLREGQARGYSAFQLANGVPEEDFGGVTGLYLETWRGRSETIARTEIATAQNAAALDRYAATGMVERVQIVESEDTDAPCAARNGTVVPLSSKPGLLHPNCRMSLIPVVDEMAA